MPNHRKVAPLSDRAFRLHVTAMAWCVEEQSDGVVPTKVPPTLPAAPRGAALAATIAELIEAALWSAIEVPQPGWNIHDFLIYNLSKAKAAELAKVRAEAGQKGGKQSAERREAKPKQVLDPLLEPSLPSASHMVEAKLNPDPDTDPLRRKDKDLSASPTVEEVAQKSPKEKPKTDVDEIYEHWIGLRKIRNPKARRPVLSDKDRTRVAKKLRGGMDVDTCKLLVEGLFLSPFHLGENDRNTEFLEFEHAFRDNNFTNFTELALAARDVASGAVPRVTEDGLPIVRAPNRDEFMPKPGESAADCIRRTAAAE